MKVALCDICISAGKLQIAKCRIRDRRLGITISYCTEHKNVIDKAKTTHEFAKLMINAIVGFNRLLAQA